MYDYFSVQMKNDDIRAISSIGLAHQKLKHRVAEVR